MPDLIPAPRDTASAAKLLRRIREQDTAQMALANHRLERENRLLLAENAGLHRELAAVRERLANALHPNTQES